MGAHPPASTPPALSLEALSFSYGDRFALDGVCLDIEAGVFTALLGPNGAGKTTLFSLIARLFRPSAGRIRVGGHDLGSQPNRALARLGIVFQQPTLDLDLTVGQNLRYAARLHGIAGGRARARIAALLDRLELGERQRDKVRELSGGLRRRVELARALLHEPPVLLLDEATVGLDVPSRTRIVDDVHALAARGVAVLWATHLVDEVRAGDRVVVMHRGAIRADAECGALMRQLNAPSLTEAFAALIGAAPPAAARAAAGVGP
ncbi:MAG: ATP-binding cassette domain-containing protein [Rhodospirillales bacterium]|nr:ATP-binding cassette domain-containing protein [Rhodospirillales bacterium]